jgi:hypothetical protein
MDIQWNQELTKTSYQLLREAGYIPIHDRRSGKQSYVYRLSANRYPRFHVYVEEETDNSLKLHLHMDTREHGWGERLHDTEYEGENVKRESDRLKRWLMHFTVKHDDESEEEKGGFFSNLFGG